ncbi:MAG: hypothetical protein ACYC0H_23025, partial [Solirubrobacteraceae bacterium]
IAPPKTARSRRAVALADQAIEALIRHRERQQHEKELLGEAWVDEDLVFPNSIGGPMQRDHLVKRDFSPLLQRAGLPAIRFHDYADLRVMPMSYLLGTREGLNRSA